MTSKKDARERFILSNQLALLSTSKDFIVYNGLAKFNRMVAEKSYIIRLARLDYEPTKDDTVIDFTRSKEVTNDTTVNTSLNYFTFTADLGGHYAWYEEVTKELLLVVKNAIVGTNTIYYGIKINTTARGIEIDPVFPNYDFVDKLLVQSMPNQTKSTNYEHDFIDTLNIGSTNSLTNFVFPYFDFVDKLLVQSMPNQTKSTNYEHDFIDTLNIGSTNSLTNFVFPYFDFVDTLGVETNPTATKSTNIGFDFVDTLLVHSSVAATQRID